MAPAKQLGVLAFAAGAVAVPHAQFQPFKRHAHAHASAPAGYESSYVPNYGGASSSADPWGSSSAAPVSESAPAYPSASGSWSVSVEPASGSASWSAPAGYPSGSSAAAVSGSASWSAAPYPSASGSKSGWAFPTGGYSAPSSSWGTGYSYSAAPTGYSSYPSGYPSISVCTETSTLIWKTTTSLSTYYVTHTLYESSAAAYSASVAPASVSGYDPSWSAAPAGYSAGAGSEGATCVPDVTVTETVKTTVYVTPGASTAEAVASASATPACWTACFQQAGITSESQLCGNTAVDKCIQDTCSSAEDKAYWSWYDSFCPATSSAAASVSAVPTYSAAPSYPAAPSSASAAAPSYSAPASGGLKGKRGLAYNDASLANSFAGSAAAGWGYDWISSGSGLDSSIPYIPMLHDASSTFTSVWQSDAQSGIANGAAYLFSFNEPDMSTQANLSPEAAAAAWKQWMEPFAGQAKLVAPSVTNSQSDGMGLSWLQSFLDACSDCTIDAVAQHWYFPTNDVDNFKTQITNAAQTAGGKGVFVSEFGAVGTDEEKSAFLSEVMPWMDSNPDVIGYSYFMVSDGLLMDGTGPSSLGNTYSS